MDNSRLPKRIFSELASGTRNTGSPVSLYKDYLGALLRTCSIPILGWESIAADHHSWHLGMHKGICAFEETHLQKCQAHKQKSQDPLLQ